VEVPAGVADEVPIPVELTCRNLPPPREKREAAFGNKDATYFTWPTTPVTCCDAELTVFDTVDVAFLIFYIVELTAFTAFPIILGIVELLVMLVMFIGIDAGITLIIVAFVILKIDANSEELKIPFVALKGTNFLD